MLAKKGASLLNVAVKMAINKGRYKDGDTDVARKCLQEFWCRQIKETVKYNENIQFQ